MNLQSSKCLGSKAEVLEVLLSRVDGEQLLNRTKKAVVLMKTLLAQQFLL